MHSEQKSGTEFAALVTLHDSLEANCCLYKDLDCSNDLVNSVILQQGDCHLHRSHDLVEGLKRVSVYRQFRARVVLMTIRGISQEKSTFHALEELGLEVVCSN